MKKQERFEFGLRLRELRRRAGLSQSELATIIGTTRPAVTSWENGWTRPKDDKYHALADALGVTTEVLSGRAALEPEIPVRPCYPAREEGKRRRRRAEQTVTAETMRKRTRAAGRKLEAGATSGFIAYAEMRGMPEFLYEVVADMHIRRMLFLCGQHDRAMFVKKTVRPDGIEWSI